ncbi:MAG: hypothetical protein SVR08_16975, partial [Spirochaetota bacterium]|nr:hypothetical protein [Spirochaetota bacterium]
NSIVRNNLVSFPYATGPIMLLDNQSADQHNLSSRQFRYYKIKFEQRENNKFVELKKVKYRPSAFIELITADGLMLRFREDISPANFRNIIMSLQD